MTRQNPTDWPPQASRSALLCFSFTFGTLCHKPLPPGRSLSLDLLDGHFRLPHFGKMTGVDEEEDNEVVYEDEVVEEIEYDDQWCLVGRLLSGKVSDFMVFQNIIADLWKPGKGMYVKIIEQNRFLFKFYYEIDIQRVIMGSPWTYDHKQLIIECLKEGDNPRTVALNKLDICVQIHDL
ncbi:hypothetical protein F8388_019584 [Cannabis sativa]|uniref:DUF4283 domain-containing protein n=1 Tax=Cannabis sativa TaxID=3483 RepID=A0A7J6FHJ7_CANSA|nr:hypothetical protein F8388_019584 [Cannabis sativa]KAF4372659.1 hypothetical protein G4B88_024203 [Cannabis sativa]